MMVCDIAPGTASTASTNLTNYKGELYFAANDGLSGSELWRTDGTSSGTILICDIQNGPASSFPSFSDFSQVGDILYMVANDGIHGAELWRTDGTSTGTSLVCDIASGPAGSSPSSLREVGGQLYFIANDGGTGAELWKSDGTSTGTMLVSDIAAGSPGSSLSSLANLTGTLCFAANDGVHGTELWRTDGTSSGTVLVRDVRPGPVSGTNPTISNINGFLLFAGSDGLHGQEPWFSDGTTDGTVQFADIAPDSASSSYGSAVLVNHTLFLTATTDDAGNELFRAIADATPRITSITSSSLNGAYATGQTLNITLNFSEPLRLTGGHLLVTLDSGAVLTVPAFTGSAVSVVYTIQAGESSPHLNVTSISLESGAALRDVYDYDALVNLPSSNLVATTNFLINPLPPTTISIVTVNSGDIQHARLTSITLNFTTPVNAAQLTGPGVITLIRTAGTPNGSVGTIVQTGAVGPNGRITVSPASGLVSSVTLTFDNADGSPISAGVENGSLADGRWQLSIPYFSYTSSLNDPNLRRLFGDSNNDGTVDGTDFGDFGSAFGQTVANSPFDSNGDGTVDGTDFAQFGTRFGITL
jgi:ELWxxDGT repeat protein